ncbi:hypothetical protein Rahaq_5106 (plasmid) [Rahnella aceris]|uniref:Uncharacterized protein n=1 Tax=Rahnella sp. (strain Y9602) TaxID=2703885 RepID=A0A0H3FHG9_RAHSY|nr:hypothetical protein Rahaq_5106 [Rahnella aceris]
MLNIQNELPVDIDIIAWVIQTMLSDSTTSFFYKITK